MSTLDARQRLGLLPTPHGEPVHALDEVSLSVQGSDFVAALGARGYVFRWQIPVKMTWR